MFFIDEYSKVGDGLLIDYNSHPMGRSVLHDRSNICNPSKFSTMHLKHNFFVSMDSIVQSQNGLVFLIIRFKDMIGN